MGTAEGVGAGGEERTPLCPGTGFRYAAGLSLLGRQPARARALETGLVSRGFEGRAFRDQTTRAKGGKVHLNPSEAESVLTRKWLFEGDRIRKAGHWVQKASAVLQAEWRLVR